MPLEHQTSNASQPENLSRSEIICHITNKGKNSQKTTHLDILCVFMCKKHILIFNQLPTQFQAILTVTATAVMVIIMPRTKNIHHHIHYYQID